jgi:hypothetical protein
MGGEFLFLLVVIVVLAVIGGVALYLTGGALWGAKTSSKGDLAEGTAPDGTPSRPEHVATGHPTNSRFVGANSDPDTDATLTEPERVRAGRDER